LDIRSSIVNTYEFEKTVRKLVSAALATAATAGIALAVGYWAAAPNATIVGSDLIGTPVATAPATADGPA
jgi:hypothetical protein